MRKIDRGKDVYIRLFNQNCSLAQKKFKKSISNSCNAVGNDVYNKNSNHNDKNGE